MVNLADYEQWKARRQSEAAGAAGVVIGAQDQQPDQIAGDLNLASEYGNELGRKPSEEEVIQRYEDFILSR